MAFSFRLQIVQLISLVIRLLTIISKVTEEHLIKMATYLVSGILLLPPASRETISLPLHQSLPASTGFDSDWYQNIRNGIDRY